MAAISTPSASFSSSISSSTPQWKYDVFLSFRGEDTRNRFTDHLYVALKQKGILTFRDEEKLETGKSISLELLKAIEKSRFAIVILSRNYASSTWCLDEPVKIIRCMKEMKMMVLPIFYDVDPSTIRKQMGTFAQAFAKHEENFKDCIDKVQAWRTALREVANLKGWHVQDRPESQIIQSIVGKLWHKLSYAFSECTENLVGIISRVEKLESCLDLGSNNIRMVGIWGMGGIGKTTLARVVFRKISNKFEGCCFLANVREVCEKDGLVRLQQQLILQILNENMGVEDVNEGVFVIKNKLRHKKILLVLDDVDQLDQLNKLAGDHIWFGLGSRVIITTRDKHLLQTLGVDEIYEANGLTHDESLHLLSLKAFKKDHPPKEYLELSRGFVYYANDLPLAIEILGSFLFGRGIDQWKSTLNRLKQFPEKDILKVLRISFEGLHETEKEIFLNIACFFNHKEKKDVVEILNYLDLFPDIGLGILFDKSLVKFDGFTLWMHDLLQEMGKNIVYEECPKEPGKRGKLWLFKDINDILTENTGTKAIQGIVLKLHKQKEAYWNPESFSKVHDLKLLIIDNVHLLHEPKYLPNALRFLDWSEFPSKYFPPSFQQKSFDSLKFIKLKKSLKLIETPDFNEIPNLEKLDLEGCINLRSLHPSIGVHQKLTFLNLGGCKNLRSLPSKFEMESLEIFILSGCSNLKRIPEFGENMESVSRLYLDGIAITKLPTSIGNLTGLASLNLKDCKNLKSLPSKFEMEFLEILILSGCPNLKRIPEFGENMKNVSKLYLDGTAITKLPTSIENLTGLVSLNVKDCKNLMSLPSTFFNMKWLKDLNLSGCSKLPENLVIEKMVEEVDVSGTATGLMAYSNTIFRSLKTLALGGFKRRSPNHMGLLPTSLWGLCSLTHLNLSYCNLNAIPNDICRLFSLEYLYLSGNNFSCLPENISQLSRLFELEVNNCTSLLSLPKLPLNIYYIWGKGCTSLETLPNQSPPNSPFGRFLYLTNCNKLAENQGFIDNGLQFFAAIISSLRCPRSDTRSYRYNSVIPGSEIPKWFTHQSIGDEVSIQEPNSLLCNEWIGIAVCAVFCCHPHHQILKEGSLTCWLIVNGKKMHSAPGTLDFVLLSDHTWLHYFLPQFYDEEGMKKSLCECDANGFSQIGIKIESSKVPLMVKKCGLRMVYKKDIEDLNSDNSTAAAAEGYKAKRTRDDYDGAGSSNYEPHPKRIERVTKFMGEGNSNCEESSENKECAEELGD
uniref:ADP-ribosyl cyclase/cyclic ADP-ribose hydrolase n=2 Tax=Quercus lobata TaxID=97700 RepID=A0A7N2LK51_QUELO